MVFKPHEISKDVFSLDKVNQQIIRCLANNGPSNLETITKWVCNSGIDNPPKRWGIKNRIIGSPQNTGLIEASYVYLKKFEPNQKNYSFYLLPKGILASTSNYSLRNNWFFKKTIDYANDNTVGKKYRSFIIKYITSQITVFLAYHYVRGLQLTWQKNTNEYFHNFVIEFGKGFKIKLDSPDQWREFNDAVKEYAIFHNIFLLLTTDLKDIKETFHEVFGVRVLPLNLLDRKNWVNSVHYWMLGYHHNIIPEYKKQFSTEFDNLEKNQFNTYKLEWEEFSDDVRKEMKKLKINNF